MLRVLVTVAALAALLVASYVPAFAAGGLTLSTAYPSRTVKAGDSVSVSLGLENTSAAALTADLKAVSLPSGWTGDFEASSSQISQVYLKAASSDTSVTYKLAIPDDAAAGQYDVQLSADAGNGAADVLALHFTIDPKAANVGESTLTVDKAAQNGTSGSSLSFSLTLDNKSETDQTYSLSANAPVGWTATFKSDSTQVSSVSVKAGETAAVTLSLAIPSGAQAGENKFDIMAVSADQKLTTALDVTVTGSYSIELTTPSGRLNLDAFVNKKATLTLTVNNKSNTDINEIALSSSAPDGWTVAFDSDTIESIPAGGSQQVTAYVTPGKDAMAGDYTMTLTAKSANATDDAEIRVTVKTETSWGIVGLIIIAVLVVALVLIFRKYGRR